MMFKRAVLTFVILSSAEAVRKDVKERRRLSGSRGGKGSSLDVDTFCALTEKFAGEDLLDERGQGLSAADKIEPIPLFPGCFEPELLDVMCPDQKVLCDSKTSYLEEFCGTSPDAFFLQTGGMGEVQLADEGGGGGGGGGGRPINIILQPSDKNDATYPCSHNGCSTFVEACCPTTCCEGPDVNEDTACAVYTAADDEGECLDIDNRYCPCDDYTDFEQVEEFCEDVAGPDCSACLSFVSKCCPTVSLKVN
eukprot:scaffold2335_cov175-Amphora_coffeaeformis.AAC.8